MHKHLTAPNSAMACNSNEKKLAGFALGGFVYFLYLHILTDSTVQYNTVQYGTYDDDV